MKRRMGPNTAEIVTKLVDVFDFDSQVVTALHRFRDVHHYYNDMCGANEAHLLSMVSPDRQHHQSSVTDDEDSPLVTDDINTEKKNIKGKKENARVSSRYGSFTAGPSASLSSKGLGDVPSIDLDEVERENRAVRSVLTTATATTAAATTAAEISPSKEREDGDMDWVKIEDDHAQLSAGKSSSSSSSTVATDSTSLPATAIATAATSAADKEESECIDEYLSGYPVSGLPVPLLALQAADDPIIHVDTMPCRSGVASAVDNLVRMDAVLTFLPHAPAQLLTV
jgi:hypothetical protein